MAQQSNKEYVAQMLKYVRQEALGNLSVLIDKLDAAFENGKKAKADIDAWLTSADARFSNLEARMDEASETAPTISSGTDVQHGAGCCEIVKSALDAVDEINGLANEARLVREELRDPQTIVDLLWAFGFCDEEFSAGTLMQNIESKKAEVESGLLNIENELLEIAASGGDVSDEKCVEMVVGICDEIAKIDGFISDAIAGASSFGLDSAFNEMEETIDSIYGRLYALADKHVLKHVQGHNLLIYTDFYKSQFVTKEAATKEDVRHSTGVALRTEMEVVHVDRDAGKYWFLTSLDYSPENYADENGNVTCDIVISPVYTDVDSKISTEYSWGFPKVVNFYYGFSNGWGYAYQAYVEDENGVPKDDWRPDQLIDISELSSILNELPTYSDSSTIPYLIKTDGTYLPRAGLLSDFANVDLSGTLEIDLGNPDSVVSALEKAIAPLCQMDNIAEEHDFKRYGKSPWRKTEIDKKIDEIKGVIKDFEAAKWDRDHLHEKTRGGEIFLPALIGAPLITVVDLFSMLTDIRGSNGLLLWETIYGNLIGDSSVNEIEYNVMRTIRSLAYYVSKTQTDVFNNLNFASCRYDSENYEFEVRLNFHGYDWIDTTTGSPLTIEPTFKTLRCYSLLPGETVSNKILANKDAFNYQGWKIDEVRFNPGYHGEVYDSMVRIDIELSHPNIIERRKEKDLAGIALFFDEEEDEHPDERSTSTIAHQIEYFASENDSVPIYTTELQWDDEEYFPYVIAPAAEDPIVDPTRGITLYSGAFWKEVGGEERIVRPGEKIRIAYEDVTDNIKPAAVTRFILDYSYKAPED